jgi:hypothetical protein
MRGAAKGGLLEADGPTRVGDAGQRANRKASASSVQHYMFRTTNSQSIFWCTNTSCLAW